MGIVGASTGGSEAMPAPAAQVGYTTHTFASTFSAATVDTGVVDYGWYRDSTRSPRGSKTEPWVSVVFDDDMGLFAEAALAQWGVK